MSRILAISGKRGAGKDTLANYLVCNAQKLFGEDVVKMGLADPIKWDIQERFQGDPHILWGTNKQKEQRLPVGDLTYRQAMQVIGAAYTAVDCNYFVQRLMRRAAPFTVVCDLRLKWEAEYLRQRGVKLIRLTRAENPDDSHLTEVELDEYTGFDAVVNNHDISAAFTQQLVMKLLHSWGWLRAGSW